MFPYSALWFDSGHIFSVSLQRPGLSQTAETAESPQLQFIAGHRHPFRAAEADPHDPHYSTDHRDSPVAVSIWWSMSPLCGPCSLTEGSSAAASAS